MRRDLGLRRVMGFFSSSSENVEIVYEIFGISCSSGMSESAGSCSASILWIFSMKNREGQ